MPFLPALTADLRPERPLLRAVLRVLPFAALLIASFLLYGPYFHNPPFFDDDNLIQMGVQMEFWHIRWLPYATYQWTYHLAGFSLPWFHFGNMLLHAVNAGLFLILVRQLLERALGPQQPGRLSYTGWGLLLALLFTLHPVAVYAIAYLNQRSIIMATLFSLLMLLSYLEGLRSGRQRWLYLAAALYLVAVFSKEHVVMMPAVALALTLLLKRPSWQLARRLWLPYLLFAAIAVLITLQVRNSGILGHAYQYDAQKLLNGMARHGGMNPHDAYPLSIITEGALFFKYWLLWLVPNPAWMSIDMFEPFAEHWWSWPQTPGFIAFVLYGVVAVWLLLQRGQRGLVGLALLWPWLLFATELATVRIRDPFVLYRCYPWLPGALLLLPALLCRRPARQSAAVLAIAAIGLLPLAANRLATFEHPLFLWDDAAKLLHGKPLPGSDRVYYNRAVTYMQMRLYQPAIRDYTRALAINPTFYPGYHNRAATYFLLGQYSAAIKDLSRSLGLHPHTGVSEYLRGVCYQRLGQPGVAKVDFAAACRDGYKKACVKSAAPG
jgi:protein O-mannosyl-transferase